MIFKKLFKNPDTSNPYVIARQASLYILILNFILFVAKAVIGWLGDSFALFADGINNLTDTGTSLALYFALRLASRPPDAKHAYGHGKIESEVARLLGVFVLATAGGIFVSAIQKIDDVDTIPSFSVIIVATISIFIKEYMYRFQAKTARKVSSRALEADAINHRTDVGATFCVLVGTLVVKIGGQQFSAVDDIAAIIVGLIMAYAAARVVMTSTQDMLDTMPPAEIIEEIRKLVLTIPGIHNTEKILGRKMGMFYNIDLHIEVDPKLEVMAAHYLGHQAAELLQEKISEVGDVLVHLEPYLTKEEREAVFRDNQSNPLV